MARNKHKSSDFVETSLPSTRKEQYKDLLQTEYRTLITLGLILLIFALPELFLYFMKDYSISNQISQLMDGKITADQEISNIISTYIIYDLIEFFTLSIFFVGLAGAYRVFRVILWNDGLFFKDDFIKGIKANSIRFILNALIIDISILGIDLSNTVLYRYSNHPYIISGLIILLVLFIIMPIVLFNLSQETFYSNSIIKTSINSFKLSIANYPKMLLFVLPFTLLFAISNINIRILILVIFVLTIVFLLPLYLAKSITFSLDLFDKYLNDELKEIKDKGLYKKNKY